MLLLLFLAFSAALQMDTDVKFLWNTTDLYSVDAITSVPVSSQVNLTEKLEELLPGGNAIVATWTLPTLPFRLEISDSSLATGLHLLINESHSIGNLTVTPVQVAAVYPEGVYQRLMIKYDYDDVSYFFFDKVDVQPSWVQFGSKLALELPTPDALTVV